MSNLEAKVNEAMTRDQQQQENTKELRIAIATAKSVALNMLVERSQEAAELLKARGSSPEMLKEVIVDEVPRKKWLSGKVNLEPIKKTVGMWAMLEPAKKKGVAIDTDGKIYLYKDNTATALETFGEEVCSNGEKKSDEEVKFDVAVRAIGASPAGTVDRVVELSEFWEGKVVDMVSRVLSDKTLTPEP